LKVKCQILIGHGLKKNQREKKTTSTTAFEKKSSYHLEKEEVTPKVYKEKEKESHQRKRKFKSILSVSLSLFDSLSKDS